MEYLSSNSPARDAGKKIEVLLRTHRNVPILLLLSGGSAFSVYEYINETALGEHITVSVVDERFSRDPEVNNFSQLEETAFFDVLMNSGVTFLSTKIQKGETLPKAVMHFEKYICQWKKDNPQGIVITTLGVGSDGHTAGILPFPKNKRLFNDLFLDEEWVSGYDGTGKNKYPLRFTLTGTFLLDVVDYGVIFVTGEEKKGVLEELMHTEKEYHEMPAQLVKKMKASFLYTDMSV